LRCGDDAPPNSASTPLNLIQIANGEADPDLANIKAQLMKLTYANGTPYAVVLRWFWEFNINAGQPGPAYDNPLADPNGNNGCFVAPGTETNVPAEPTAPPLSQQFVDAWDHIHQQLSGNQPIPLITYDWNPNVIDSDPQELGTGTIVNPNAYYPGPTEVDWIGADGYDRLLNNQPKTFSQVFSQWYGWFSSMGKPMIIGETGSCNQYGSLGFATNQVAYLQDLQSSLETSNWSAIRAVMYFDAKGNYVIGPHNNIFCDWNFDTSIEQPQNMTGIQSFAAIAQDAFFTPVVPTP
jgi:hypothetical protein